LSIVTVHPAFKKNPPDSYYFKDVKRVEEQRGEVQKFRIEVNSVLDRNS
jgi:hypothetical protein